MVQRFSLSLGPTTQRPVIVQRFYESRSLSDSAVATSTQRWSGRGGGGGGDGMVACTPTDASGIRGC